MSDETSAARRKRLRNAFAAQIRQAMAVYPGCQVFTARGRVKGATDTVAVVWRDGEVDQQHSITDVQGELHIRFTTSVESTEADDHLDDLSAAVELKMAEILEQSLIQGVGQITPQRWSYRDAPDAITSDLNLIYLIEYED